ncbi:MAG: signal peptidase II [Pseudomonadota bacterium]
MRHHLTLSLPIILAALFLDQLTKWAAWEYQKFGNIAATDFWAWLTTFPAIQVIYDGHYVTPFLNLVTVWNRGVSFGFLAGRDDWRVYFLVGMALVLIAIMAVWLVRAQTRLMMIALSMIIGGALGNIVDRLRFGAVADFIDFHIGSWHYPAFNGADSFIVVGVCLIVLDTLFLSRQNKADNDDAIITH